MPSENDLADSFGASRSTVIRALRDVEDQGLIERRQGAGSFVTPKAVQQVMAARTTIGLLKSAQSGRYADSIVDQIQNRLSALLQHRGSALIVHTIEKDDEPVSIARKLMEQRVGGLFLVPLSPRYDPAMNEHLTTVFTDTGRPVVLLDGDYVPFPRRSGLDVVGVENRHCGYLLAEHLLSRGLRRILFLATNPHAPTVTERQWGYMDAMRGAGIDVPADWIQKIAADELTEAFVSDLIARYQPEAIICKSDEFAALLMQHLPRLGIRIPEDLKLVGFDDRPIASLLPVTLTTIRQPIAEIAEAALQLMDTRIAHPRRAACRVQVAGSLIIRQSSAG